MELDPARVRGAVVAGDGTPGIRGLLAVDPEIALAAEGGGGRARVHLDRLGAAPRRRVSSAAASPDAAMEAMEAVPTWKIPGRMGSPPVKRTRSRAKGSQPAQRQSCASAMAGGSSGAPDAALSRARSRRKRRAPPWRRSGSDTRAGHRCGPGSTARRRRRRRPAAAPRAPRPRLRPPGRTRPPRC